MRPQFLPGPIDNGRNYNQLRSKGTPPQVHVQYVIGAVVVLDLPSSPINTLDVHWLSRLDFRECRNIGMPSIVKLWLRVCGLIKVDTDGGADGRHSGFSVEVGAQESDDGGVG